MMFLPVESKQVQEKDLLARSMVGVVAAKSQSLPLDCPEWAHFRAQ